MAEPTPPSAKDTLAKLNTLKQTYLEKSGVVNHNPHLFIGKNVQPLIDAVTKLGTVTDAQAKAVAALPSVCPVIDPNYTEPQKAKIIAPSMPAGAK